ncbi:hypothetical protein PR202_ga23506 [Eleusine coracana subsp. coracana]|uniref:Uncharacterized protein n=1 Tax=Eleusine coracana subsp. coracana TaxID=191504 RepID=A0AAV5D606_ELECO|nr:hypothetical protein PR202_ga23506 [Eleusine coracana subsp. coracana]
MQTEARVGVVVDGGNAHASVGRRQEQRHIGTAAHLAAGGFAGAVSKTCTAPLARLTILFQVAGMHSDAAALRKYSIWNEASRIVQEEGFGAFWKGNLVTIVHRLPYSAISFYSYERYKNLLQAVPGLDRDSNYVGVVRLLGGGLAGITAASVTYPLDVVRTRLATQNEGLRGFYRGIAPEYLKVVPSVGIAFMTYETLKSMLSSMDTDDEC